MAYRDNLDINLDYTSCFSFCYNVRDKYFFRNIIDPVYSFLFLSEFLEFNFSQVSGIKAPGEASI